MKADRRAGDSTPAARERRLIACDVCRRQYEVSRLSSGAQFRCQCGESLTVTEAPSHSAEVVRCSSCGGPRALGSPACGYCGADFTLHERDLHTICPECMARISDRARYCHHCATLIAPLEWIRRGGLARARRWARQLEVEEERARRMGRDERVPTAWMGKERGASGAPIVDFVEGVLQYLGAK